MAEPEDIEKEQKVLEAKYNPIMMRVYQASGGAPGGPGADGRQQDMGGMPGQSAGATNVEDLDWSHHDVKIWYNINYLIKF